MGREGAAFRQRRSSNRHLWKCHPRDLREKVIALNGFIGNMDEFPDGSNHHAICLQDAVRQRGLLLMQLASLCARKSRPSYSVVSGNAARRLLLLYAPSGPLAWALHSIFFFFLIAAFTGLIRTLFHIAYLRPTILVPIVIGDFVIVILVRLASFYVDQPKRGEPEPAASTV
jgi:hypothetical protein